MTEKAALREALEAFVRKQDGPPFAEQYREDAESFDELLKAESAIARATRRALRRQADNLDDLIDWAVVRRLLAEAEADRVHKDEADPAPADWWNDEDELTAEDMRPGMQRAARAGVDATNARTGLRGDQHVSSSKKEAERWARTRSLEESKTVNATTRERMRRIIARGVEDRWSNDRIRDELRTGIPNKARAEMIARTETIRAYSAGSQSFARSFGATHKQWLAAGDACPICEPLDQMVVEIDDEFEAGIFEPPDPHPNCRCAIAHSFAD